MTVANPSYSPEMFTYAIQSSFTKNRQLERVAENLLFYLISAQVGGKPLGGYLAATVLGITTWDAAQIATQTREGGNQPDVTITISSLGREVGRLVIELKIDANLGDKQIERYLDSLASVASRRALMIVARHRETLEQAQKRAHDWKRARDRRQRLPRAPQRPARRLDLQRTKSARPRAPRRMHPVPPDTRHRTTMAQRRYVRFFREDWAALAGRLSQFKLTDQQTADLQALLVFAEQAGTVPLPLKASTADSLTSPEAAESFARHLTFADTLARSFGRGGLTIYGNSELLVLQRGASGKNYGVAFEPQLADALGSPTDFYCMEDARSVVLVTNAGFDELKEFTDRRLRVRISENDWSDIEEQEAREKLNRTLKRVRQRSLVWPGTPPDSFYQAGEILWEIMTQSLRIFGGHKAVSRIHEDVSERFGFTSSSKGIVIEPSSWAINPWEGPLRVLTNKGWYPIPPTKGESSGTYVSRVLAELIEPPL